MPLGAAFSSPQAHTAVTSALYLPAADRLGPGLLALAGADPRARRRRIGRRARLVKRRAALLDGKRGTVDDLRELGSVRRYAIVIGDLDRTYHDGTGPV